MALSVYLSPTEASGSLSQDPALMEAQKQYLQFLQTKPADVSPQAFRRYLFDLAAKSGDESLKQNAGLYADKLLFRPAVSTALSGSLMDVVGRDKNNQPLTLWERLSRSYANFLGPEGAVIIGGPDPASSGASEISSLTGYVDLYKSARNKYENKALGQMDKSLAEAEMNKATNNLLALVMQNPKARASAQALLAGARLGLLGASTASDEQMQALAYSDMQLGDFEIMDLLVMGMSNARAYASSVGKQALEVSQKIDMNFFVINPDAYSAERRMVEVKSLARGYNIHYEVVPDNDYRPFANMQLAGLFHDMALKQGFSPDDADLIGQIKGRSVSHSSDLSIRNYIDRSKAYNELCPESKGAYNPKGDEVDRFMGYFGQNSMLYVVLASLQVSDRNGSIDLKSVQTITEVYSKSGPDAARAVAKGLGVDFGPDTEKAIRAYAKLLAQPLISLSEATHERALPTVCIVSGGSGTQASPLKLAFSGLDPSYCLAQAELYKQLYPDVQKFFNGEEGDQSKKDAVFGSLSSFGWSRADTDKLVDSATVPIEGGLWWAYNQKPGQPSLSFYGGVSYNEVIHSILQDMEGMEVMLVNNPSATFTSFLTDSLHRTEQDLEVLRATNPELDRLSLREVLSSYQNIMKTLIGERQEDGGYSGGIFSHARVASSQNDAEKKYVSYPGIPDKDAQGNPIYTAQDPDSGLYHGVKVSSVVNNVWVPRPLKKNASGHYSEFGENFFYIADDAMASSWWSNIFLPSRRLDESALNALVARGFSGDVRSGRNWENFLHPLTLRLKLARNFGDGIRGGNSLHANLPSPTLETEAGRGVELPVGVFLEGPKGASGQPSFSHSYMQNPDLALRYMVLNPGDGKAIVGKEVAAASDTPLTFDTSLLPPTDFSSVKEFTSVGPASYAGETTPANSDWVLYRFNFTPSVVMSYPYLVQAVLKDPDQPLYTGTPYSIPIDRAYASILSPSNPKELNAQGIVNIKAAYPAEFVLAVRNAGGLLPMLPNMGSHEIYWAGQISLSSQVVKDPSGLVDYTNSKMVMGLKLTGGSTMPEPQVIYKGKPDNSIVLLRDMPVKFGTIDYFRNELDYYSHEYLGERFYLTKPLLNEPDVRNPRPQAVVVAEAAPILRARTFEAALDELSKRGVGVKNETQLSNKAGDMVNSWRLDTEPVPTPFPPAGGAEKGSAYFVRLNSETGQYEVFRSRSVELSIPSSGRLLLKPVASAAFPNAVELKDEFLDPTDPSRTISITVGIATKLDNMWVPQPILFNMDTRDRFLPSVLYYPDKGMPSLSYQPDPIVQPEIEKRYKDILSSADASGQTYRTDHDGGLPTFPFQNTTADRAGITAAPDWPNKELQDYFSKLLQDLYQYKLISPSMDPNKPGAGLSLKLSDRDLIDPFSQTLFENVQFSGGLLDAEGVKANTDKLADRTYRPFMESTSAPAPTTPSETPPPKQRTTQPAPAPRQKTKEQVIPVPKLRHKPKAPRKTAPTTGTPAPQTGQKPALKPNTKVVPKKTGKRSNPQR
ncbi:MAG: hypothetical protein M1530_04290 [Candidatus Marsarchaeota archaeon]|nr:hypothetical protein [Candidatus Marsarchaeota archaeon]